MRTTRLPTALAASLLAAGPAGAQFTIGDPLIPRSNVNTTMFEFIVFKLPDRFDPGSFGLQVQSVSVFGGPLAGAGGTSNIGRQFVPLLVTEAAGTFTVTGVGTQRTISAAGVQTFDFGLTAGSAVIGAGTRMAWHNVGPGAIHFDFDADGSTVSFTSSGSFPTTPAVGTVLPIAGTSDRAYSIQFSTSRVVATVPEPSTVALVGGGLLALAGVARRRRA